MEEIMKDPELVKFFRKRDQKESTRKSYAYHFLNFYKATDLTPTMAIEEAIEYENEDIRLSKRKIDDRMLEYLDYLKDKKASPSSMKHGLTMIRTFYSENDIMLPKPPVIRIDQDDSDDTINELPGIDDIKKAITNASPLYQSIIVLMASSGMGRGEIIRLTIQNFIDALKRYAEITVEDLQNIPRLRKKIPEKIGPLEWKIKRAKMRYTGRKPYTTFSTPESLEYLLRYLEDRPKPQTSDESLFLNRFGDPVSAIGFNMYFNSLNQRCGWGLKGKQAYFRSHVLRKWFASTLEPTSLGFINTNRMLGHEPLNKTDSRYFKPNIEIMYHLYYDNMELVTLFSKIEVHDKTNERVAELEAQIEHMRKTNEEMARSIQQMALQSQKPEP